MNKRTILSAILAVSLSTTSVFASGIPVGCSDGTRNEPVPPIVKDAWIEIAPDIPVPGYTIQHPDKTVSRPHFSWTGDIANPRGRPHCIYKLRNGDTRPNPTLRPDCLTPWDFKTGSGNGRKRFTVPVPPTVIPDSVIEVPDIPHEAEILPQPDKVIPTRTIKLLVGVTGPWWDPKPKYEMVTQDGSCPSH